MAPAAAPSACGHAGERAGSAARRRAVGECADTCRRASGFWRQTGVGDARRGRRGEPVRYRLDIAPGQRVVLRTGARGRAPGRRPQPGFPATGGRPGGRGRASPWALVSRWPPSACRLRPSVPALRSLSSAPHRPCAPLPAHPRSPRPPALTPSPRAHPVPPRSPRPPALAPSPPALARFRDPARFPFPLAPPPRVENASSPEVNSEVKRSPRPTSQRRIDALSCGFRFTTPRRSCSRPSRLP
jgi:hypothetical protein